MLIAINVKTDAAATVFSKNGTIEPENTKKSGTVEPENTEIVQLNIKVHKVEQVNLKIPRNYSSHKSMFYVMDLTWTM